MPLKSIGYEDQWKLYEYIVSKGIKKPLIIDADELAQFPERMIKKICDYIEIEFIESSLNWSSKVPEQWKEWEGWHKEVSQSNKLLAKNITPFNIDMFKGNEKLLHYYNYHLPFFEKLKSEMV